MHEASPNKPPQAWYKRPIFRIVIFLGGVTLLMLMANLLGLTEGLTVDWLRSYIRGFGAMGVIIYFLLFALTNLLSVPGLVFIIAGMLIYGQWLGTIIGLIGSAISLSVSFFVVRKLGGKAVGELKAKWARKVLTYLDDYPIRVIFVLRFIFMLSPQINYLLAMSNVRYRDYLMGSMLGLVFPIGLYFLGLDYFFPQYSK